MEQRGVLVAIAGRRDGVRVYALQEVKRAIEWKIDTEIKRERDKLRRETVKKTPMRTNDSHDFSHKSHKASLSTPPPGEPDRVRANPLRKSSHNPLPVPVLQPPVPLIPRSATPRTPKKRKNPSMCIPPPGRPPPYTPSDSNPPPIQSRQSYVSLRSPSNVFSAPDEQRTPADRKAEWVESSDDEAIDVVAAGSSGSHLDERTSATLASNRALTSPPMQPIVTQADISAARNSTGPLRRRRPSNLDLSLARLNTIPAPEPSPVPTLLTLRQALTQPHSPSNPETPFMEVDDEEEDVEGHISLAQALLESRIPGLQPIGTRQPQEPILITPSPVPKYPTTESASPRTADGHDSISRSSSNARGRRRRWSIMISSPTSETPHGHFPPTPTRPLTASSSLSDRLSPSFRSQTPPSRSFIDPPPEVPSLPELSSISSPPTSRSSRFFPRIINALHGRRSDERFPVPSQNPIDNGEGLKWTNSTSQTSPPKLEYVKLPGTKGAILIKAVETAKKRYFFRIQMSRINGIFSSSFLAILCGENGEKVELFAGTYRTALGLSRTFILPDSPRSLELQLQGDDLVEVFLVFAQNVFGLEPATVRVREVRIGRAERRAARRRARENRSGDPLPNDPDSLEEETNVNVSIGVTVASSTAHDSERSNSPILVANDHPESQTDLPQGHNDPVSSSSAAQAEELLVLATAQIGSYTTFQQLAFAPNFPLASIADDYIIPPTYPSFLEYRGTHEPKSDQTDFTQTQFSPPGLPVPTPTAPSKWFYRDPKNVVHGKYFIILSGPLDQALITGPWKASLMQAWYKDGLLPPDLPVRREEDTEYMLLKELRLQSVDPSQPFRAISPPVAPPILPECPLPIHKPLLSPISLLGQPRHFGPPALFFSSRGGHCTSIVDSRGRSVLKGKFFWSNDSSQETKSSSFGKMGDIKRLEALDIKERAVLVAMRQRGLEVVDLGDALLKPADESRTILPHYDPPLTNISRRAPFVWKIGTPIVNTQLNELMGEGRRDYNQLNSKKVSVGSKQNSTGWDPISGDTDMDPQDEFLFLGRKEDEIYFCERNAASFRILRLSTNHDTF